LDIMHMVRKGRGFRISLVFCNYEYYETGERSWDGAQVVSKWADGNYERYCPTLS